MLDHECASTLDTQEEKRVRVGKKRARVCVAQIHTLHTRYLGREASE